MIALRPGPALDRALSWLIPPGCARCHTPTAAPHGLCPACFGKLRFIAVPACPRCGTGQTEGDSRICPRCIAEPPPWRRAVAALRYDAASKSLALGLKEGGNEGFAVILGRAMAQAGAKLLADADALLPVPLHRWRQAARGFNQSALLAREVARHAGTPLLLDALRRRQRTRKLGDLSAAARAQTLSQAVAVRPARRGAIAGRRLILIDDVLTSGATSGACARALLDAGASCVDLLVAARVPDPRDAA